MNFQKRYTEVLREYLENPQDQQLLEAVRLSSELVQTTGILKQIEEAYENLNAERVSFHAHKLKSSARTVGANSLSDLCFDLEVAGRKEDWLAIDRLTDQMGPCLEGVTTSIDQM